jgi:hypothetical protein
MAKHAMPMIPKIIFPIKNRGIVIAEYNAITPTTKNGTNKNKNSVFPCIY